MTYSERVALHYNVIANTATSIAKVAKDLEEIANASYFNERKYTLRKNCLEKYINQLQELYNKEVE